MIKLFISPMLIITAVFILKYLGIIINISNSLPLGIYKKSEVSMIHRGDIIALCLPKIIAVEGKQKSYLSHGDCPANTKPIIKQVIAIRSACSTHGDLGITLYRPINHNA